MCKRTWRFSGPALFVRAARCARDSLRSICHEDRASQRYLQAKFHFSNPMPPTTPRGDSGSRERHGLFVLYPEKETQQVDIEYRVHATNMIGTDHAAAWSSYMASEATHIKRGRQITKRCGR